MNRTRPDCLRVGTGVSPCTDAYDPISMRLHLIDGTFELFRAFYGRKETRNAPDGRNVTATYGIMRSTLGLLRDPEVTHVAAAFDTVIESFRNDLFEGYKTGDGIDPELYAQFPLAERALRALGVTVWSMIDFEADDALATAILRWCDDVEQVVICSPDKDLAQTIIDDRVVSWDRIRNTWMDEAGVREKFGIAPESIPDYLALVGDTADGVPGIPGWGAKSAATLLARWRWIESIPPNPTEWEVNVRGAAKLAATLNQHREEALLYRTLTTLRRDVPLEEDLADLEWRGVDGEDLDAFCEELGLDTEEVLQVP